MPTLEPRFHWTLPRPWPVTPETIAAVEASHTGRHLHVVLEAHQDAVGRDA